ncbi:protein of unknown function [Pararobbsia alpina]|uniref:hypothetical protein n=1 Tax=Pararobbsia alpina TaxID=621374 RepID=UPI0039A531C5
MTKQLAHAPQLRPASQDLSLFETPMPFAIGFVTRDGDVMGSCLKFSLDASTTATIHLNSALTAGLICSLTEQRNSEWAGWMPFDTESAESSLPLPQREIDTVKKATVAERFHVSKHDGGLVVRFDLMSRRHVDVPMTWATVEQWLKRMDGSISQLETLRDAPAAMC